MPVPYDGRWFYPTRTDVKIPYTDSPVLRMWKSFPDAQAQYKANGDRTHARISPDRELTLWTRHRDLITKQPIPCKYEIPTQIRDEVLSLAPKGVWTVFDLEFIHKRTKMIKDVFYFYDAPVWQSELLIGVDYATRYRIIADLLGNRFLPLDSAAIHGNLYIAENIPPNEWDAAWAKVQSVPYIEGLVFKRFGPVSNLQYGHAEKNNSAFMCRARKPYKNALF